MEILWEDSPIIDRIADAARDQRPVEGLTHNFYRYPARFSPQFAAEAIRCFSVPGDKVLDPYMGGATTVIEAMIAGRKAIGSDINQLAVFVAKTKVTLLTPSEVAALTIWAKSIVSNIRCNSVLLGVHKQPPKNMELPKVRWLRKLIALLLETIDQNLPTSTSKRFARCALLNVGQWALNGKKRIPSAYEFRERVTINTLDMLASIEALREQKHLAEFELYEPILRENDSETIHKDSKINSEGLVDLVVTSPPYPGIHMLYHRWQVDGRKETDAPYWITGCRDGAGAAFYNFADRRLAAEDRYFIKAERNAHSIRQVMRKGAIFVQMIAFSNPETQLKRYLQSMENSGFSEVEHSKRQRIWRDVPGRKWHANFKGSLSSSKEVVLIHEAK